MFGTKCLRGFFITYEAIKPFNYNDLINFLLILNPFEIFFSNSNSSENKKNADVRSL